MGGAICASCSKPISNTINVTPHPESVSVYSGSVDIAGASFKMDESFGECAKTAVEAFEKNLASSSACMSGEGGTKVLVKMDKALEPEEYSIDAKCHKISIKASSDNGVLYALETLKQLLPVSIYTGNQCEDKWELPQMRISDKPRFGYRGLMIDVARHFFTVEEIKGYIDLMAIHKLNRLHWHLTDDQGWRIEIKKYPQLTEKSSIRQQTLVGHNRYSQEYDGTPYGEGMWYSQEQIKEVVEYAASKGISVVPEIDLPGHMVAALHCFPELGCTGGPYKVRERWGVADEVLCAGNEATYTFLEGVLEEVCELFPYEYLHIGGDECPKKNWEACEKCQAKIKELSLKDGEEFSAEHYLQSYVTKRVSDFLAQKGKKIIGWDEIIEGEVPEGATVMSWRGVKGGVTASALGFDVIMAPQTHLYFDRYQSADTDNEPLAHGGCSPLDHVYGFEPISEDMTAEQEAHIIGVQANVWTEYILDNKHLEYMLLPRLAALSEIQWCQKGDKDWDRFILGTKKLYEIYDELGCNYATHNK